MDKKTAYQDELTKWTELFSATDEATKKAASGLIAKASRLHSMCWELEQAIEASGAIKIHPEQPDLQKQVPAVKEYARLAESYANIVNKLNAVRLKNTIEGDEDDLSDFE